MSIIVKLTTGSPELSSLFLRQFPGRSPKWGNCEFYINCPIDECDWWIVCHSSALKKPEKVRCDPRRTIFASMEPYDLSHPQFYQQFSTVITCDKELVHPRIINQNIITWWAGISVEFENGHKFSQNPIYDYDAFSRMQPEGKYNRVSIITSANNHLPGHAKRLQFIEKLINSDVGSCIDLYGGGRNPILDKFDAIYHYKYHLALENSVIRNYWSEKIADPFLGFSYPFYYGCPNIYDYFPHDSLLAIDIDRPDLAISQIREALASDLYNKSIDAISKARDLVLGEYNLFNIFSSMCSDKSGTKVDHELFPPSHFSRRPRLDRLAMIARKAISRIEVFRK